jgi:hypothetical protein
VSTPAELEREWMAQWRRASAALAHVRADELAHLSEHDALAATDTLLALAQNAPLSVERLTWSGLIDSSDAFTARGVPGEALYLANRGGRN